MTSSQYIGRLAPSPTGAQHLGNARTFLIAWLLARRASGQLWLRIEDLETPRIKPWAFQQVFDDLRWLGLDWDETIDRLGRSAGWLVQSERTDRYREVLQELIDHEAVYPCSCTRSEIESMAAAPHEAILEGPVYPGTCASRCASDSEALQRRGLPFAWRFRMPQETLGFADDFRGDQRIERPDRALGDFVVARMNGSVAYQLAVVVDDHDTRVTRVVRGDDLVFSTYRQLALYRCLKWESPSFCHLPLVVGADGRRLAKRHGDTRLAYFREQGISSERIVGYLAYRSGLLDALAPARPIDLLSIDPLAKLSPAPCLFDPLDAVRFLRS